MFAPPSICLVTSARKVVGDDPQSMGTNWSFGEFEKADDGVVS